MFFSSAPGLKTCHPIPAHGTSATTSPLVASTHINIAIHCRLPAQAAARRAQLVSSARWLHVLKKCRAKLHWLPFSQALSMVFSRMVFMGSWERHLQTHHFWAEGRAKGFQPYEQKPRHNRPNKTVQQQIRKNLPPPACTPHLSESSFIGFNTLTHTKSH